jgi:PAS domain S-box-containing protein
LLAAAHLTAIIQSSDDAIVSKDLTGRVISWNPAAERIFGYGEAEMVGKSIRILIPDDRQGEEDLIISRISSGERVPSFETWRRRKDGTLIRVAVTVSPIHDASGRVIGASKIARDISHRHLTEQALHDTEVRFRMLADNISQLAWIAGPDGGLTWYNQRWYDFTGTDFAEMEGWGWQKVHHPDHVHRVTERFSAAIASGKDWEDTFPLRGADGQYRWFLSRAKAIRNAQGTIDAWFGTNTDITELLEKEEQIRVLMMEVNHRSKNMLAVVQALARRSAQHDPEFLQRFEKRIGSLAANQDLLIRRGWQEIPVEELVEAQLAFLGRESRDQVSSSGDGFDLSPRCAEIIGMALHELATNALKYGALSVRDGSVAITWSRPNPHRFAIEWSERNGPAVLPPERPGFGSTLVRDIPARSLKADVMLDFADAGVRWRLECDVETAQTMV